MARAVRAFFVMDAPRIVHEHPHPRRRAGAELHAYVLGYPRDDGTWAGWIEFAPVGDGTRRLRTAQETSQPSLDALVYWATGLEDIYFDGALSRARE